MQCDAIEAGVRPIGLQNIDTYALGLCYDIGTQCKATTTVNGTKAIQKGDWDYNDVRKHHNMAVAAHRCRGSAIQESAAGCPMTLEE